MFAQQTFTGRRRWLVPNLPSHTYKYIAIYSNKVIVNFEIQAAKYLQIQATSKMQSTTRNVYFTIHATVYKVQSNLSYRECQGWTLGFCGFWRIFQGFLNIRLNFTLNVILYREKMKLSILLKCLLKD